MEEEGTLHSGLIAAGVDAAIATPLSRYGGMLLAANRSTNLTGAGTAEKLLPHLLDSLSLRPYVAGPIVDVGSGGGLPGIPLAIATGATVTLIEAIGKKAAFLQAAMSALSLAGEVRAERAEVAARDPGLREGFGLATARAVASAPTVAELTLPLVAVGGLAVLQRGALPAAERDAVADAATVLGATLEDEVLLDGGRRLLLLRKISRTPDRFPRRTGVPEKRPLCM